MSTSPPPTQLSRLRDGEPAASQGDYTNKRSVSAPDYGLLSLLWFAWVTPLVRKASGNSSLEEGDAFSLLSECDDSYRLSIEFDEVYNRRLQEATGSGPGPRHLQYTNHTAWTLWELHQRHIWLHVLLIAAMTAIRLSSPVLLREFLVYLTTLKDDTAPAQPPWHGWALAFALGLMGYLLAVVFHQMGWIGRKFGHYMRQQCIAAVHAKVLRLNGAVVSDISGGTIITLISNDVRRFDDASPFGLFVIFGPLETGIVLLMIALELGFWPALAGVSSTLALIPLQAGLVRHIGGLRRRTAAHTDRRVRLTSEAVQGALAMKMLSWEGQIASRLHEIRSSEARHILRMAHIRALNMGLMFADAPLTSFVTFAVARAVSGGFSIPAVFYTTSLLALPRLSMYNFFVMGLQAMTELWVSLQRIDRFLSTPEPPPPSAHRARPAPVPTEAAVPAAARRAGEQRQVPLQLPAHLSDIFRHTSGSHPQDMTAAPAADTDGSSGSSRGGAALQSAAPTALVGGGGAEDYAAGSDHLPAGQIELRGSDYDWRNPLSKATTVVELPEGQHTPAAGAGAVPQEQEQQQQEEDEEEDGHVVVKLEQYSPMDQQTSQNGAGARGVVHRSSDAIHKGPVLRGVKLRVVPGELLGICGEVGSGKTSLLMALLGELQPLQPRAGPLVHGTMAYCSQVAWVVAGTVRSNVVFGSPLDLAWYQLVLSACALEDDIAALPAGDLTELGEQGINLSGGQKARVALARACYSRADIILMDDPLSAVDPRVGRLLFDRCIGPSGLMQGSTRLLVTHQQQYLPSCDRVLVLRGGQAAGLARWRDLEVLQLKELAAGAAAADGEGRPLGGMSVDDLASPAQPLQLPSPHLQRPAMARAAACSGPTSEELPVMSRGVAQVVASAARESDVVHPNDSRACSQQDGESKCGGRAAFSHATHGGRQQPKEEKGEKEGGGPDGVKGRLTRAEERSMGDVSIGVYIAALRYLGLWVAALVAASMFGGQAVYLYSQFWLARWARSQDQTRDRWLVVFGALTCAVAIISLARAAMFFEAALHAASRLHQAMVAAVLQAPLAFFHTNPTGRILNRFSKDLGQVDDQLPQMVFDALQGGFMCLGAFVLVAIAVPVVMPLFLPLGLAFYLLQRQYVSCSREIKRWDAVSRSPVVAAVGSTLTGLPTIRAYGACDRFHQQFLEHLSLSGSWAFAALLAQRWVGLRLDIVASTTLLGACVLAMVMRKSIQPAILGLALTHVLQLSGLLQFFTRQAAEVENSMTSVERMMEYTELPQEPTRSLFRSYAASSTLGPYTPLSLAQGAAPPPPGWPQSGRLQYVHVTATYRPNVPPVLRDVSFELLGGQSCGVVGRTGSGKSSLMLTLFRLIDVNTGAIYLDGLDTARLGLDALRCQLAIIPQDPVLFSGTLRSNLDPWEQQPDAKLWSMLEAVQLRPAIEATGGLHAPMAEGGGNLSVGQRQLFCLARALLQEARVLALDEATANVDRATDALIQRALRNLAHNGEAASSRVLLIVAHRLDTVVDCDRLLVLSAGELVEQGSPAQLATLPEGYFSGMLSAARTAAAAADAQPASALRAVAQHGGWRHA